MHIHVRDELIDFAFSCSPGQLDVVSDLLRSRFPQITSCMSLVPGPLLRDRIPYPVDIVKRRGSYREETNLDKQR